MTRGTALRALAWLLLAGLIFVTLSPIGLRPNSPLPTQVERAGAVALVGFVFACAYPRRIWLVVLLVLGSTALLELLQLAAPSRHGRVLDLAVKLVGGGIGLAAGWALAHFASRRRIKHPRD
jgi:VanZ family protein